jgi:hypothetical protein
VFVHQLVFVYWPVILFLILYIAVCFLFFTSLPTAATGWKPNCQQINIISYTFLSALSKMAPYITGHLHRKVLRCLSNNCRSYLGLTVRAVFITECSTFLSGLEYLRFLPSLCYSVFQFPVSCHCFSLSVVVTLVFKFYQPSVFSVISRLTDRPKKTTCSRVLL